jgi:transposase-like protein
MSDEEIIADLTPARLFQHVKNLQRQVNTLAAIVLEMKSTTIRCCICKLTKRRDEFHTNSMVCIPCKSKYDRKQYLKRKAK